MTQITIPTFIELSDVLSETKLQLHASEAHGLVSGILAANASAVEWGELVTGDKGASEALELIKDLYEGSAQQLKEFLFEFRLILPNEDETLTDRAEALSLWCQGFLTGLKVSGVPIESKDASELSEAIADLSEIANMDYEEVVDNEEDEAAYLELVEFVRMAVILIYQELHEPVSNQISAPQPGQLH